MMLAVRDDPTVVALVRNAAAGDAAAWDAIVERYSPLVWSVCRKHGLTGADADDAGAGVWLRLVEGLRSIREPAALAGWLATTANRECYAVIRAKNKHLPVDTRRDGPADVVPSDEWVERQEAHAVLRHAFAGLGERCRRLLALLFADPPVPYTRIGDELGMAVGAIGPTRARCLAKLREHSEIKALS